MIGLTLWHADGMTRALDADGERVLQDLQPGLVNIHSWPRAELAPIVKRAREASPGARIWLSPGVNGLAVKTPKECKDQAARWRKSALDLGAELVLINAEGPAKEGAPGWTSKDPSARAALADRAKALLEGLAGSSLKIGFTSHDCPLWHHLTWEAWLGADSPVTVHAPQVYPGVKSLAGWKACRNRFALAAAQWNRLVKDGVVRADLGPQGAGWWTYTQGWGAQPEGTALILDQRDNGLVWAAPSRLAQTGFDALAWTKTVRAKCGDSAGAIARWQAAHGLVADGILGPKTVAAMDEAAGIG